ncbi:hypothetical protein [Allokutzneria oryzae]|uniref:Tetratricopeptide repeat protein n=1 Tax=Allokutzneria oryzae TaxID=1378989 RepID=A0ABV6A5Q8_9PSEU
MTEARWQRCVELNTRGAELSQAGDHQAAAETLDEAYRETFQYQDIEALILRAAIAGNRAGVAATLGDFDGALRWSTETIELARGIESQAGNSYGTAAFRANALGTRAQYLRFRSQYAEALADLDEAFDALELVTAGREHIAVSLHAIRASVLAMSGRFQEGTAEAQSALDLAYETAPHYVPYAHMSLAEIADSTGDQAASTEHFRLARELFAATNDANGEATALLSLARLAHLGSRDDEAERLYAAAEGLLESIGNKQQLTTCLHGRAAVAVSRGQPREALAMLERIDAVSPVVRIATYQVQGSAFEALGDFDNADERYHAARELAEQAGLWHTTLTTDWWWAETMIRRATDPELYRRALDRALPAALAAEALRHRFSPGPLRERWVALAAAPATRAAFTVIAALGEVELAVAYIDHVTATVSLQPSQSAATEPLAPNEFIPLPFAASALVGPAFPLPDLDLPPRVRVEPDVPSALDKWIDLAEQRYGFAVRSNEVIRSW